MLIRLIVPKRELKNCWVYSYGKMADVVGHKCETPDCGKNATLQCPTCLKIGIQGSYFCNQECFKGYWKSHKVIHLLASKFYG